MFAMLQPFESGNALRDSRNDTIPRTIAPGICNVGIGMNLLPGLIASPFGMGADLSSFAYKPRMIDPNMLRSHTSLLLAAAYGDSLPKVIATEPSNTDLAKTLDLPSEDTEPRELGLESPGVKLDEFDDMKRALDLSSLPLNPVTGSAPSIDTSPRTTTTTSSTSTFRARNNNIMPDPTASLQAKKARLSPIASPRQPPFTPGSLGNGQPSLPGPVHTGQMNGNGLVMNSPMHFGGPLTPNGPVRQNSVNMGSLTVPSTPVMGMMPGMMSYGMNTFGQMNVNYPTSPILSPSMNPNIMTGNYGPAAAAAAAAAAGNLTGRTVYVGNLPAEASVDELLNLVRFGPIESVRLLPERSCVFISFLDGSTAAGFHADAQVKKLALHGQELKIGWGKASNLSVAVATEVQNSQATRNVFVGNLDEATTEQDLRDALSSFGPIDQVKIVRDKNIGFVHFLGIGTAMQVVAELPTLPGWENKRVSYGKDRCAYVPKAQQAAVQLAQQQALAAVQAQHGQAPSSPFAAFSPMTPNFSQFSTPNTPNFASPVFPSSGFAGVNMNGTGAFGGHSGATTPIGGLGSALGYGSDAAGQMGNRTVYLGNLMPGTTTEELCNNIRGGQLQQIKHLHDKNIAFVTFVDPNCALNFYNQATTTQLTLNTRRLKIGWGKHSGQLNPALMQAIKSGASRNVYIGQIQDFEKFTAEKLKQDFGAYGDIEMVNFYQEKNAAFVNYTSIQAAQAAIESIKTMPDYADLRVSFGKDRCANAPRSLDRSRPTPARNGSQLSVNGNSATPRRSGNEDEIATSPTPELSPPGDTVMAE